MIGYTFSRLDKSLVPLYIAHMKNAKMNREYTNRILELVESGLLDKDMVIKACLTHMSEAQVRDMARMRGFIPLLSSVQKYPRGLYDN